VFLLAVSASALTLDPETLRAAGFDDWIAKPVRLPTLFALLDRRLRLRFQESEQDIPAASATGLPEAGTLDPAWREAFLKNLELGDSEALLASLEGREDGPGWQRLRQLVREYRYEELGRFLRAGGDDGHA
jgi:CheY-like chemotaxis protein